MADRQAMEQSVRRWIESYVGAWNTNDPDDISALFTDDAQYRTDPWLAPWSGSGAIVSEWLARQDEPDSFSFEWDVVGIDGTRAFVQGVTRYREGPVYSNLWVIDLADDGRATAFTEWWMDQADES